MTFFFGGVKLEDAETRRAEGNYDARIHELELEFAANAHRQKAAREEIQAAEQTAGCNKRKFPEYGGNY